MNNTVLTAICLLTGYLLGSINPAIILSKAKGKDIRSMGSGNAGATNTLRNYGKASALIVMISDILKCVVAVILSGVFAKLLIPEFALWCKIFAATGCILGHNFPLYFGFKGGKGVVVSATAIFMLDWKIGLIVLACFIIVFALSRFVSLGSVLSACVAVAASLLLSSNEVFYFIAFAAVLTIIRHRTNIVRLIKGTESKTTFSKK